MTERDRHGVARDATSICVGTSSAFWNGRFLSLEIDEISAPIPTRLKGIVRVYPEHLNTQAFALDGANKHHWWPMSPRARIEVNFEKPAIRWNGTGYLDSNFGEIPLEHSFSQWDWSRAHAENEATVLYDTTNRDGSETSLALRFDSKGHIEHVEAPRLRPFSRGLWGVPRKTRADGNSPVKLIRKFEDAPFYTRSLISTTLLGTEVEAVHESLSLDRFNMLWVQALLPFRMPRRAKTLSGKTLR
jgi:carotenoid 1,2-hydratase